MDEWRVFCSLSPCDNKSFIIVWYDSRSNDTALNSAKLIFLQPHLNVIRNESSIQWNGYAYHRIDGENWRDSQRAITSPRFRFEVCAWSSLVPIPCFAVYVARRVCRNLIVLDVVNSSCSKLLATFFDRILRDSFNGNRASELKRIMEQSTASTLSNSDRWYATFVERVFFCISRIIQITEKEMSRNCN